MNICRACLGALSDRTKTVNIFEDQHKNCNLSLVLLDLFNFKIEVHDEFTKEVCQRCANKIVEIHEFYLMFVESDQKLRSINEETDRKPNLDSYEFTSDNVIPHEVVATVVKREDSVESFKLEEDENLSRKLSGSTCTSTAELDTTPVRSKKEKKPKCAVSLMECFACHKTYKSLKTVRRHAKVCNLLVESQVNVKKERYYHKNENNEFACDSCAKCFATRQSVYAHIQRHIGQKVLCNICGKCFSNRNNLTKHHKTVHLKEKNYQCPTCEKRYDSSYRLRIHQNSHNGIRLFACPLCPQSFITSSALSRHKKTVHKQGELYECNVCSRKFNVAYNMRAHMVTHTGIKPHNCQYCKADFLRKHKLVTHLKEVHKVDFVPKSDGQNDGFD